MKKICMIVLCMLCLALVACGRDSAKPSADSADNATPTEEVGQPTGTAENVTPTQGAKPQPGGSETAAGELGFVCNRFVGRGFLTEDFALYHGNNGRLQYFDAASGMDIVFCFDPGCEHEPSKYSMDAKLIERGCVAYDFSRFPVMLQGEKCYFLTDTNEVICSDRMGENRRVVGKIPTYILPDFVYYSEDALFVTYCSQYEMVEIKDKNGESQWIIGDTKPTRACGLVKVSLVDGTYTEIFDMDKYSTYLPEVDIRGGHLYFQVSWMDIPYIGPDLVPNDPSTEIPEGLTKENYWDEIKKHMWNDVYDYNLATGELRPILQDHQAGNLLFGNGFFAISEPDGKTALYRYSGECFRELDFELGVRVRSDSGLVCSSVDKTGEYMMIDENTGKVLKSVTISSAAFIPQDIIGKSCYGSVNNGTTAAYLSAEDFWNGNTENAVAFAIE